MSLSPKKKQDLHRAFSQLCDGGTDPSAFESLESMLANDLAAQKFYVRYLDMHHALAAVAAELDVGDQSSDRKSAANRRSDETRTQGSHNSISRPMLAAVAAVLLAAFVWAALRYGGDEAPDQTIVRLEESNAAPLVTDDMGPPTLASVRLDSGTTRLRLPSIGQLVVDGPAEFDLVGHNRARLNSGRIKMRITEPGGRGFIVETPHGEVTDLGTEFALDVSDRNQTGLIVFEGAVDLRVAEGDAVRGARVERIFGGEGVSFNGGGQFTRINSIVTGPVPTVSLGNSVEITDSTPLIVDVSDNYRVSETRCYYEIVPGGFCEDALSYVDRPFHEWNGATAEGLPGYLIGADYVKPFNDDKYRRDIEIWVTLSRPATLYVLYDDRLKLPEWLTQSFYDTGDNVAMDLGPAPKAHPTRTDWINGVGPGNEVDSEYSVYAQIVAAPGIVRLGPNVWAANTSMYGIVATPLNDANAKSDGQAQP